jgi:hypothetical protein
MSGHHLTDSLKEAQNTPILARRTPNKFSFKNLKYPKKPELARMLAAQWWAVENFERMWLQARLLLRERVTHS